MTYGWLCRHAVPHTHVCTESMYQYFFSRVYFLRGEIFINTKNFELFMVKICVVHARRILELAVVLTLWGKYFMVPFPTTKTTIF
jgi:hypothetical protein